MRNDTLSGTEVPDLQAQLSIAVLENDAARVHHLLSGGAEVMYEHLWMACHHGHADIACILLDTKPDAVYGTSSKASAELLHEAVLKDNAVLVESLVHLDVGLLEKTTRQAKKSSQRVQELILDYREGIKAAARRKQKEPAKPVDPVALERQAAQETAALQRTLEKLANDVRQLREHGTIILVNMEPFGRSRDNYVLFCSHTPENREGFHRFAKNLMRSGMVSFTVPCFRSFSFVGTTVCNNDGTWIEIYLIDQIRDAFMSLRPGVPGWDLPRADVRDSTFVEFKKSVEDAWGGLLHQGLASEVLKKLFGL